MYLPIFYKKLIKYRKDIFKLRGVSVQSKLVFLYIESIIDHNVKINNIRVNCNLMSDTSSATYLLELNENNVIQIEIECEEYLNKIVNNFRHISKYKQSEYRRFKKAVFERDNYTCVCCKDTENLSIIHTKPYIKYYNHIIDLDKGKTYCNRCIMKFHNGGL